MNPYCAMMSSGLTEERLGWSVRGTGIRSACKVFLFFVSKAAGEEKDSLEKNNGVGFLLTASHFTAIVYVFHC